MAMDLTINFGTVALRSDVIFGCLVYGEDPDGVVDWRPVTSLPPEDLDWVRQQVNSNPLRNTLTDRMKRTLFESEEEVLARIDKEWNEGPEWAEGPPEPTQA